MARYNGRAVMTTMYLLWMFNDECFDIHDNDDTGHDTDDDTDDGTDDDTNDSYRIRRY